jgi:hypothetical protein
MGANLPIPVERSALDGPDTSTSHWNGAMSDSSSVSTPRQPTVFIEIEDETQRDAFAEPSPLGAWPSRPAAAAAPRNAGRASVAHTASAASLIDSVAGGTTTGSSSPARAASPPAAPSPPLPPPADLLGAMMHAAEGPPVARPVVTAAPAPAGPVDLLGGFERASGAGGPVVAAPAAAAPQQVDSVDDLDDFFKGGAVDVGFDGAGPHVNGSLIGEGSSEDFFGGLPAASSSAAARKPQPVGAASAASPSPSTSRADEEAGDAFLRHMVAEANAACAALPEERAGKVQVAIQQAWQYVSDRKVLPADPSTRPASHCRIV